MYVQKGNALTKEKIAQALTALIVEAQQHKPKVYKKLKSLSTEDFNWQFGRAVDSLFDLHNALVQGNDVWAICDKRPRNLDTGKTYYSIYFATGGKRVQFWPCSFALLFGADETTFRSGLPKWVWSSGAIGMSRLLDATDSVFTFFKRMGGCYAQIEL